MAGASEVQQLTRFQRVCYGVFTAGIASTTALIEGVALYNYNDNLKVPLEFLSLANLVVGVAAVYTAAVVGGLSDRTRSKYRRKPYIMLFAPLWAAGLFFRFGAFTSSSSAAAYYVVTYLAQVIGSTGVAVVVSGWSVELAVEGEERNKLYSTSTFVGFIGIFAGIAFTALPLKAVAVICAVLVLVAGTCVLVYLPENTPLEKRSFTPTVTNIVSVLWNRQYLVLLGAVTPVFFINTVPALFLFFLRYCLNLSSSDASLYYTLCVLSFVLCGVVGVAAMPWLRPYGKLMLLRRAFQLAVAMGVAMFAASYSSVYFIIVAFGIVGLTSTIANIMLNVVTADSIDYDELLCGKKRASTYQSMQQVIQFGVQIAGSSIPLALMSSLGFTAPTDDDDGDNGSGDDSGGSTYGSTIVLRIWCTLFISLCFLLSLYFLSYFKIDERMHAKILEATKRREQLWFGPSKAESGQANEAKSTDSDAGANRTSINALFSQIAAEVGQIPSELMSQEGADDLNGGDNVGRAGAASEDVSKQSLDIVSDPMTGLPVEPPPFAQAIHELNLMQKSGAVAVLDPVNEVKLRLLLHYFPTRLPELTTSTSRALMLRLYYVRLSVSFIVFALGLWQCIDALISGNQYECYLIVVLTVIYTLNFSWQLLYFKGIAIVRAMQDDSSNQISLVIEPLVSVLSEPKTLVMHNLDDDDKSGGGKEGIGVDGPSGRGDTMDESLVRSGRAAKYFSSHATETSILVRDDVTPSIILVLSFIGAFMVLNYA